LSERTSVVSFILVEAGTIRPRRMRGCGS
jgi:hypothetical protein